MELTDTHCHLQFDRLVKRTDEILKNAQTASVTRFICVGTSVDDSQKAIAIAAAHSNVWATVGVHPHDGKDFFEQEDNTARLKDLLIKPKVVAVGEIGLDFYKNYSPKAEQEKLLRLQIEIGVPSGLPFIFHVRDAQHQDKSGAGQAWSKFFEIIDSYPGLHGVIHSFSAHPKQLDQALARGLYIGLNGIMTFTGDKLQLEAARLVPQNRLILETDAPFLTPVPNRGKVCEPKHIRDIAEFLAALRNEDIKELASYSTKNARELLGV